MEKLKHLFWRAGFGPRSKSWDKWAALPEASWWPKLKDDSASPPEYLDVADSAVKGLLMGIGEIGKMERRDLDKDERRRVREQSRDDLRNLNLLWLEQMTHSKAQLREKMALFWHGHFASRNINILYQQQLLHVVRQHALGSFADLLRGVSKSAAMIAFLNNQQNRKKHPNENFAREVMELFTLGRGHYSETDVREAARAFTGWNFKLNGDFVFRAFDHDDEPKTLLGKTGRFNGDDVLDILLENRQTARFIAEKLYRFLVNETQAPPAERIDWLAKRFYEADYQIMRLLDDIVRSDWFHAPEHRGTKIKSPVELWVGIRRALPLELEDPESQLMLQRALGQTLFFPPNVAGWPGGRDWIDSSALMLRLRLPQMLYQRSALALRTKDDDDQQMGQSRPKNTRQLAADIEWSPVLERFAKSPDDGLLADMARYLWQTPSHALPRAALEKHSDRQNRDTRTKTAFIRLMCTPEYQMC
jgi:uncharacterized protein (DUF1800 family)